jgi:hypothetical protein
VGPGGEPLFPNSVELNEDELHRVTVTNPVAIVCYIFARRYGIQQN